MAAAAHTPGGYGGVPQSVGKKFNTADTGTKLLSNAMRKHHGDDPQYAFGGSIGHISIPKISGAGSGSGLGKLGGSGQIAKPLSVGMEAPFFTREEARGIDRPSSGGFGGGRGRFAMGGGMSMGQMDPFWTRQEARIDDTPFHGGLIPGSGSGRTDQLPLSVGSESHVIPADAVSGLGQGSTNAGARAWAAAIRSGPYGVAPPQAIKGPGPPSHHPPTDRALAAGIEGGTTKTTSFGSAEGGAEHGGRRTSILAASGEMVIPPEDVEALGRRGIRDGRHKKGETAMDCGHRLIDEAIANIRKFNIGWLRKAPPPKKKDGGAIGMSELMVEAGQ